MPPRPTVILGDLLLDVLVQVQGPPAPGTDTRAAIQTRPGGSGANQAAWLTHLGVETNFVTRVGDDAVGRYLAGELERGGTTLHWTTHASLPTGTVVVMVHPDGERTMFTDRGASRRLGPEHIPPALFRPGRHLHLSGYNFFADRPRAAALEALRLARETGMTVSVDPSSAGFLSETGPERFLEWTRGADLCFPNRAEGALLSGEEEPARIAAALAAHYRGVALKLGADGAIYAGSGLPEGVDLLGTPAEPARVVDTTGAGDAFCAGFLAAWLDGVPPDRALRYALRAAAQAVERLGGRP